MPYDLDQFVSECRAILNRDGGPKGREQVRLKLEQLLANRDFVETYCGERAPRGLKVLYEDPELGFQILAHINDKARVSPPHDHGASWAIYGQATHYTDMVEWEREDDGADKAKLKPLRRRSLRFAREQAALPAWLDLLADTARADYALGVAVARMRGLVKGYGDTHARGVAKYEKLAALVPQLTGRADSATRLEALLKAANADESGATLEKALAEMKTAA